MKMKTILLSFAAALCTLSSFAQPATPEPGMRWVIDEATSDEFEGEFDSDKWYNSDPNSWRGRAPGFFRPEAMTMKDGKLNITVDILDEPMDFHGQTFTHQGGHVYSKATLLPGTYIEARMKANKTFMSSTFWLITVKDDRTGCDKRTTELDIQETIGYPFDNAKATQMGSNTHSRGIPEGCDVRPGSAGNHCELGGYAYDNYYTYAVWWKSPKELLFYVDGEYKYTIVPAADFDLPLAVKMVCETYNWSPVPEDGGMTGTEEERTTSYEWVRCYNSIPVDQKQDKADSKCNAIFDESISLSAEGSTLSAIYTSAKGGKVAVNVKDASGKVVAKKSVALYSGNGNSTIDLSDLDSGEYSATASFNGKKSNLNFKIN